MNITSIKSLGQMVYDFLKTLEIIKQDDYTGKIIIELNLNQGSVAGVKILPEIRG